MKKTIIRVCGFLFAVALFMLLGVGTKSYAYSVKSINDYCKYQQITETAYLIVNTYPQPQETNIYVDSHKIVAEKNAITIVGKGELPSSEFSAALSNTLRAVLGSSYTQNDIYEKIYSIYFKDGITNVPKNAFSKSVFPATRIAIFFGSTLEKIEDSAFFNLSATEKITFPKSVKYIGKNAFNGNKKFSHVTIEGDSVTIDEGAFRDCSSLSSVQINGSVKEIGVRAFCDDNNLLQINLREGLEKIGEYAFYNCGIVYAFLPDSLTSVGQYAFSKNNIETLVVGNSLKTIPSYCFNKCSKLRKIIWGNSVEVIDYMAFTGCISLESLSLPDSLKEIAGCAFFSDSTILPERHHLDLLIIPEGVTKIGEFALIDFNADVVILPASLKEIGANGVIVTDRTKIEFTGTEEQYKNINFGANNKLTPNTPIIYVQLEKPGVDIEKLTEISLDNDKFWYDGMVHCPKATVKSKNTILVNGYSMENSSIILKNDITNYKPGIYNVSAKGVGRYEGTLETTYEIAVKPTSIKKVKLSGKAMTITVNKQAAKYVSGYEVQYSTKENMKKAKKKTLGTSFKSVTGKITGLKKNTKYFIQVRTYVKVGKKKFYSDWSPAKLYKTKK